MPNPSPVHAQLSKHCQSLFWKDWAGYFAVKSFDTCHEREYFAIRNGAGLIDVSPLFKYEVKGPDAGKLLDRIMSKPVSQLAVGRMTYLCWCDDEGFVLDDGTVARIGENHFRVTAAEPSLAWFSQVGERLDVTLEDSSERYAALSLQGPHSRQILQKLTDYDMSQLKFFGITPAKISGVNGWISRTGYTGDLGYELWVDAQAADVVYEGLLEQGRDHGLLPCGLDAMDITRIEAGFIMNGVDYFSANHCLTDEFKDTPFELGLDWCVKLDRPSFIGQKALKAKQNAPRKKFVGLDVNWLALEAEFAKHDLPPEVSPGAWRDGKPLYDRNGNFIGQATSGTWSPLLKKNIAIGQVRPDMAVVGNVVQIEITVAYQRIAIDAVVVQTPFFNPERKRS